LIHELNNQLTGITGYAQLLLQKCDGDPFATQLERILQAGERAQVLLENFRESTQLFADVEPVSLSAALDTTLRARRFQIEKRNITVTTTIAANLPTIQANPGHVQLALGAILDNAYEKLVAVGTGMITIRAQVDANQATVEVQDTGGGGFATPIPWQSTKAPTAHAGLGLTVARWVAEALGGRCEVDCTADGQTAVRWIVPLGGASRAVSA